MSLHPGKLKQTFFLAAILGLGFFLFWLLKGFLSAFLGAVVFYVLLRQPHFYLTEQSRYKLPKIISVILLMLFSFVVMVLPVILVTVMLSGKITFLINHYEDVLRVIQDWSIAAEDYLGFKIITEDNINKLASFAAQAIPKFLSATANAVVDVFVLYFLLYFMLYHAREFETEVRKNLPFKDENDQLLLSELKSQTLSNSIGIMALAVLQGITALIGYLIFGVNEAFFWAVLTGIMSVIPVVGTTIVWLPLVVFLFVSGQQWQAVGLLIYGSIIIANVDNVFRFILQKQIGNIHPLVTFFGVIVGLNVFGFVGLIFGPLLISYFLLLLKIYRKEYLAKA